MLARFIAINNLPINFGDNPYWQEYISQAYCQQYKNISRNTTRQDIIDQLNILRQDLIKHMGNINTSVTCTSDIWEGRT